MAALETSIPRKHGQINPIAPNVSFLPQATCGPELGHDENGCLGGVGNAKRAGSLVLINFNEKLPLNRSSGITWASCSAIPRRRYRAGLPKTGPWFPRRAIHGVTGSA